MDRALKAPPPYAIASVDHALRLATTLQVEGALTVTQAAERLGVARSTAHRLLAMLVYRDFAVRDESHVYHAGPVLEMALRSDSEVARLRKVALPHLMRVVDLLEESANLAILTGSRTRFIASVECDQALRVTSREGMVFPAYRTTAGLLLLADLPATELDVVLTSEQFTQAADQPNLQRLRTELTKVRRNGFALNRERSERGLVAVGVPVRGANGEAVAGLSVSMPSVRYDRHRLPATVSVLRSASQKLEKDLASLVKRA